VSSFIDVTTQVVDVNAYKTLIPVTKACAGDLKSKNLRDSIYHYDTSKYSFTTVDYREDFFKLPSVDMKDFVGVLPSINYKPSYVLEFTPKRYEGVTLMHESALYPPDFTDLSHMSPYETCRFPRKTDSHHHPLGVFKEEEDEDDENDEIFLKNLKSLKKVVKTSSPTVISINSSNDRDKVSDSVNKSPQLSAALHSKNFHEKMKEKLYQKLNIFKKRKLMSLVENQGNLVDNDKDNHKENAEKNEVSNLTQDNHVGEKNYKNDKITENEHTDNSFMTTMSILNKMKRSRSNLRSPLMAGGGEQPLRKFVPRSNQLYGASNYNYRSHWSGHSRREKPLQYKKRVLFKDGVIQNMNVTTPSSKILLLHYYPLFGTAIYYMVQTPPRRSLWKYKTFLSKCRTDGNLPLYPAVSYIIF